MKIYCPECGKLLEGDNIKFCFNCGADVSKFAQKAEEKPEMPAVTENAPAETVQNTEAPKSDIQAEDTAVAENTADTLPESHNEEEIKPAPETPTENPPVTLTKKQLKKLKKAQKKQQKKNRKKLPWIIRFLRTVIIIAAVLFLIWFGFANMITLRIHSDEVLEKLNSGSLDLAGTENAYTKLPNYVKSMLDESTFQNEYGPITTSVLPYISAERVKVNGLFGASSVVYRITAPDIENWLLNLDESGIKSEDDLLRLMQEYIPTAPSRSVEVTVDYDRKNIFSVTWRGNYYTREFADAVCGGFNSAYNVLYEKAMQQLWEVLGE